MLVVRPMHESEEPFVRDTWTRSIDACTWTDDRDRQKVISGRHRNVSGNSTPYLRVGVEDYMATWAFHAMHRHWVKSLWPTLDVVVAAHPANDEAVGWCAFAPAGEHPLVLHYVYVLGPPLDKLTSARRRGTARMLLEQAALYADDRPPRFAHIQGSTDNLGHLDASLSDIVYDAWRRRQPREQAAHIRGGLPMH